MDGAYFADPLRRYANSVANDMKLCYRGTLTDGELKSGAQITKQPEVRGPLLCTPCQAVSTVTS